MAEFQWWLLIVGLVAGGGLVAVVTSDGRRREEDIADLERRAETTWIAERLAGPGSAVEPHAIDAVLRLHREFLALPPPDRLIIVGEAPAVDAGWRGGTPRLADGSLDPLDVDPDQMSDEIGDDGGRGADQDLARAGVEHAPSGQEADTGPDGEQRRA